MIDKVPLDILSSILGYINETADLKNVSVVSRLLHQHANPHLYRSITIRASDEQDLAVLDLSILSQSARHLKRCPKEYESEDESIDDDEDEDDEEEEEEEEEEDFHDDDDDDVNDNFEDGISDGDRMSDFCTSAGDNVVDEEADSELPDPDSESSNDTRDIEHQLSGAVQDISNHDRFLAALESRLIPLLHSIPDGSLRSFNWSLGTCVPRAIVDYLSDRQCQIRSLTIITDITCDAHRRSELTIFHLRDFTQLRTISWTASTIEEFEAFGSLLRSSATHLRDIKFDCGSPDSTYSLMKNPFAERVLRTPPGQRSRIFPALQRLTLLCVSFEYAIEDIISSFGITHLPCLKLQDCFMTNGMLVVLANSYQPVQLNSLELNFTGHFVEQYDPAPLTAFLQSFKGLHDLFVLCPRQWRTAVKYRHALSHHSSTLRRLVHHPSQGDDHPSQGDGKSTDDATVTGLIKILPELEKLQYLGIRCDVDDLSSLLAATQPRPPLKLLHLRVTGWVTSHYEVNSERVDEDYLRTLPAVKRFANWVFGPDGLPALKILAYGDFSFQGRKPNVLYCRSQHLVVDEDDAATSPGPKFHTLTAQDTRLWNVVQDNLDFLEACPEDYLLHHWWFPSL